MDVDNGTTDTPASGNFDIEQSLLHQFSCMGTTDKDELVQQLQKLLGTHLNYSTAAFFLDMNNWNLQAAICSYFDVETPQRLPSMTVITDPTACENETIEPNVRFTKTWHIKNSGDEPWPAGCTLQCAAGNNFGVNHLAVPCLQPGEGYMLTLEMISPSDPGTYQTKWRLLTNSGSYFGDPLWTIITVAEDGTMELTNQLSHLSDLGSSVVPQVQINPFIHTRNVKDNSVNEDSNMC